MSTLQVLKISQVEPDPNQPRKRFSLDSLNMLKKSVKRYGIKNPLLVEKRESGKFLIIDGERRYRVADELGLKEVPVIVEDKKKDVDRIVEQFHIQEQHEAWTTTEKATVVLKLSKDLKLPLKEIGELLGITERQIERYASFGRLINQSEFQDKILDVSWAGPINNLKTFTSKLLVKEKNRDFSHSEQSRLEKVLIRKIKDGEMNVVGDFTKIKDSFRKDPKSIDEFLEGKTTADQMFVKTKAKGSYHLRNSRNNALQLQNNLSAFMAISDVKVDSGEIALMKEVGRTIEKFVKRYE